MGVTETFYYWVQADNRQVLGRSNSKDYACHMAERYSYDTDRFAACDIEVLEGLGGETAVVAFYSAKPGQCLEKQ